MAINFIEERFPEDISYGSSGGPAFNTTIITVNSGFEQRNINWAEARATYNVNHAVKTEAQIRSLIDFFRNVRGKAIGFRFKDWTDYQLTNEQIGIGDGVKTAFQITKTYTFGAGTSKYIRNITKPANTITVFENGIQNATATVDTTTGIITFGTPPAAGVIVTVTCDFDVPVRFDIDQMNITLDHALISTWSQINLIEIR